MVLWMGSAVRLAVSAAESCESTGDCTSDGEADQLLQSGQASFRRAGSLSEDNDSVLQALMVSLISEAGRTREKAEAVVAENIDLNRLADKTLRHDKLVTRAGTKAEKSAVSALQSELGKSSHGEGLQDLEASIEHLASATGSFALSSADWIQDISKIVDGINSHTNNALGSLKLASTAFKQCSINTAVAANSIGHATQSLLQAESSLGSIQTLPLVQLGAVELTTTQQRELASRLQKVIDANNELIDSSAKGSQCCLDFCDKQSEMSAATAMCGVFRSKLVALAARR